jgi:NitT/TauT family transport system ATP-binding protein
LRLLCGLLEPSAGKITIQNSDDGCDTGVVFQTPALVPWLSVESNVLLPVYMTGQDPGPFRQRLSHLLELTGMADMTQAFPAQMSLGMQQKVSLCRALIRSPSVLLLDEPFSGLDAITRERFNSELAQICVKERVTVVMATHAISDAIHLSDCVLVLTSRPARVVARFTIPLPRPRDEALLCSEQRWRYEQEVRAAMSTICSR